MSDELDYEYELLRERAAYYERENAALRDRICELMDGCRCGAVERVELEDLPIG